MIPATEVRLSDRAAGSLDALEGSTRPESKAVARRVRALKPLLLVDCLHGEVVRRSMVPKDLRERYGLENLYVEDLPAFWRLLYSVVRIAGRRVVVVVEIVDHRTYSKWFRGRKR